MTGTVAEVSEDTVVLRRLGTTTRGYTADDLSGKGAASDPGRWNESGQYVVYAAYTYSMAVLETAAHVESGNFPLDRYLIEITVPRALWLARERVTVSQLPVGWDAIPGSKIAVERGSDWYASSRSLLLELPSVIVPEENILVINAKHPDAGQLTSVAVRRFEYEKLFRSGKK